MAKGSGSTKASSPNSSNSLTPKDEQRLIQGFKNYMELYTSSKYSDADVRAFEKMVEKSTYNGELYRGTVFETEKELNDFLARIRSKKELTSLNDFTPSPSEEALGLGFNKQRAKNRSIVSFSTDFRAEYAISDYRYEEDLPQYPVMFHMKKRSVAGKYLQSEAEVAVSIKKSKLKVESIHKIKDDYFPDGFYYRIELS